MRKVKVDPLETPEGLFKLFMSSLFARRSGFLYLRQDDPMFMLCSTVSPDTLYTEHRTAEDVVHLVTSKKANLIDICNTYTTFEGFEFERVKDWEYYCISDSAVKALTRKERAGSIVSELIHYDDELKCYYFWKKDKKKSRVVLYKEPIIWDVDIGITLAVKALLDVSVDAVNKCHFVETRLLTKQNHTKGQFILLPIARPSGFGSGIKIPFVDGINTVSLFEYVKRVGKEGVDVIVGHHGAVVAYYCVCDDDYANIVSALPAALYYSDKVMIK